MATIPGDNDQNKRKQTAPLGMTLTPEQQKIQADAEWRRGAQQRQAEFKQSVGGLAGYAGDKIGDAYGAVIGAATTVPRTIKGVATGEIPVNVYDRPFDYSAPAGEADKTNPTPQQQAGGIAAYDIAKRATDAAQQPFSAGVARGLLTHRAGPPAAQMAAAPSEGSGSSIGSAPGGQAADVPSGEWGGTGIGIGGKGGEIVGRVNADGVAEFSNAAGDQKAAVGRQFSAGGLRSYQAPNSGEEGDLAGRGSASKIGNGIGGFSQNTAGDAALASERFERANAERGKMVDIAQRGEPRGLAVVRDSGRGFTADREMAERLAARDGVAERQEALGLRRLEMQQQAEGNEQDRALRERELASTEQRNALEGRRTQQEIEGGNLTLEQQRSQAELLRQIQDPATSDEQRTALMERYRALTTSGKDRYFLQDSVVAYDAMNNPIVGKQVIDTVTGQVVEAGEGQQQAARPQQNFEKGKVYKSGNQRAEYLGGDVNDPKNWREI